MKILQIVENLDKGAVENWLVKVFINSLKYQPNYEWTFFCILGKPGRLDDLVKKHGGKIYYSKNPISKPFAFLKELRGEIKSGRYDIIHSHHDYLSGFYIISALFTGVKRRILHIHNTDVGLPLENKLLEMLALKIFWLSAILFYDKIIGISNDVINKFVVKDVLKKGEVLYYGIDLSSFKKFEGEPNPKIELGLNCSDKVILFVGRLNSLKNPIFLVKCLKKLIEFDAGIHVVIIGEGEQAVIINTMAAEFSLNNHLHLLGWTDNIAGWMKHSDLFFFPRIEVPKEGLGIVMIEAQAAGMPCIISRGIVRDVIICEELIHIVPLAWGIEKWAEKAVQILNLPKPNADSAFLSMCNSSFELNNGTLNLLKYYD